MRLVFVHSPYLGPSSWRPTADQLSALGYAVELPDLRPSIEHKPCTSSFIAAAQSATDDACAERSVLIAHSRAGPVLPAIARGGRRRVAALLYVDAALPTPGRSWADEAPPERVANLRQLTRAGRLPRWSEWWDQSMLEGLIPDPAMRARLVNEQPRVPASFLDEPLPFVDWDGKSGYLQLSPAYVSYADAARARRWPVEERALDHLATLTAPAEVATAILTLLKRLKLKPSVPT